MINQIKKYVEKYHMLNAGDAVVIGVSGGADSVCLLFLLHEIAKSIPLKLMVVHVNHGIREDASEDADYVRGLCAKMKLPFYLVEEDVKTLAKTKRLSEEEAGRNLRYQSFEKVLSEQVPQLLAQKKAKIAVAHNQNDRVETMLFNLFRGSGLKGIGGIRPVRGNVIRPLLNTSRQEIENYLNKHQIPFRTDSTNAEDDYTRNKIRNHVLPYVEFEIMPKAMDRMAATGDILLEAQNFMEEETKKRFDICVIKIDKESITVSIPLFTAQHPYMKQQILIAGIERLIFTRKDIAAVHIYDIISLCNKEGNKSIDLPYGLVAKRSYDQLIIEKKKKQQKTPLVFEITPPQSLTIPELGSIDFTVHSYEKSENIPQNQYTKWFDYDKIKKSLFLRKRETGDYLTINEALSTKSLKDYMISEKIPKDQRDDVWVLADDHRILWVIGYRISQEYKINENTKRILQVQLRGGHSSWQNM